MMLLSSITAVLLGYLLGSFPSAQIASRVAKHWNIRDIGVGNMGALNTIRGVGFLPGTLVFIADVGKGALAVLVARWLKVSEAVIFISALAAVVGPYMVSVSEIQTWEGCRNRLRHLPGAGAAGSPDRARRDPDSIPRDQQRLACFGDRLFSPTFLDMGARRFHAVDWFCCCCASVRRASCRLGKPQGNLRFQGEQERDC